MHDVICVNLFPRKLMKFPRKKTGVTGASPTTKCKQLFDEQVARTKDEYKFSTAKDPLFNSTRIS